MKLSGEIQEIWDDLLQQLPLPVRDGVRARAEALAEEHIEAAGSLDTEDGVRAFVQATPVDLRANLNRTLNLHGLDPVDFEA